MLRKVLVPLVLVAFLMAGCGDDDADTADATTTTEASSDTTSATSGGSEEEAKPHTEATQDELKEWQADLDAVGCWAGPVDGIDGPQTEAAIRAFQAAKGLEVDGLLGPATKAALSEAAANGETVCTDTTGSPTTADDGASGGGASLSSANYSQTFTIGSCQSSDETSIELQGQVNNMTLQVSASGGSGTLAVSGGTEGDGITLDGEVTSVQVGDAGDFTVSGTFTGANNDGEAFTLSGSCA